MTYTDTAITEAIEALQVGDRFTVRAERQPIYASPESPAYKVTTRTLTVIKSTTNHHGEPEVVGRAQKRNAHGLRPLFFVTADMMRGSGKCPTKHVVLEITKI